MDLSQYLEKVYSLDQCCCVVISSKCQLLKCLLKKRGEKIGIMLHSHRSNFILSLKFSSVKMMQKGFLINERKQITLKDVVHESRNK